MKHTGKIRRVVSRLSDVVAESDAELAYGERIASGRTAYEAVRALLEREPVEVFAVLLLDGKNRLTAYAEVSRGTLTASPVHPREVFGGVPPRARQRVRLAPGYVKRRRLGLLAPEVTPRDLVGEGEQVVLRAARGLGVLP